MPQFCTTMVSWLVPLIEMLTEAQVLKLFPPQPCQTNCALARPAAMAKSPAARARPRRLFRILDSLSCEMFMRPTAPLFHP